MGPKRLIRRSSFSSFSSQPGVVASSGNSVAVSALTGAGIDDLRAHIKTRVGFESATEGMITARQRHVDRLGAARRHFGLARKRLLEEKAAELMAEELLQVQNELAEITGEFTSDDLLGEIFGAFCIGK